MKNSLMLVTSVLFFALGPIGMTFAHASKGKANSALTDTEFVVALNSMQNPVNPYDLESPLNRMGLQEVSPRQLSPEIIYAFTNYILRVASLESPTRGGDHLNYLSYDSTQEMLKTLLRTPVGPERDRAVIIFWSFFASASINFYINSNDLHSERFAAVKRLGVEGKKLLIRSLIEANWVYAGFGVEASQRDLFKQAFMVAKNANLFQDWEIRNLFEKHVERSLDYVAQAMKQEKRSYDAPRMAIPGQNPKSLPMGLALQVRTLLSLGLPLTPGLAHKMKTALSEPLFLNSEKGSSSVDSYYSSQFRRASSAQQNAKNLIAVYENPTDIETVRKLFQKEDMISSEYESFGKRLSEVLFDIEVRHQGTALALVAKYKNEEDVKKHLQSAFLYEKPSVEKLTPAVMSAFKEMHRLGLVPAEVAVDFILQHDLIVRDRAFAMQFLNTKTLSSYAMSHDIVINRVVLSILQNRLNTTEATFLTAILEAAIPQAVSNLRTAAADLSFRMAPLDGNAFRRSFQDMTIATLFASSKQIEGSQLQRRMPEAKNVFQLLGDLYDGSRERGARFDAAADLTKDRLFIAVVKAIRNGKSNPNHIWEQDLSRFTKQSLSPRLIERNAGWADEAVRMVLERLNFEKLPLIRSSFAQLVDQEALAERGILVKLPPVKESSIKTCKAVLN